MFVCGCACVNVVDLPLLVARQRLGRTGGTNRFTLQTTGILVYCIVYKEAIG